MRPGSGKGEVAWRLRYSPRAKRVRIIVRPGDVEVVAPPGTPVRGRHGIEAFVHSKSEWIADSLRKVEARAAAARTVELHYVDGARIPFRGDEAVLELLRTDVRRATVEVVDGAAREARANGSIPHGARETVAAARGVEFETGRNEAAVVRFVVNVPPSLRGDEEQAVVRKAVMDRMRRLALEDARAWAEHYGTLLGRPPSDVRLGNQKTIWGSCAADGIIRINRRLIEAPPAAMEYVVAHEIAHLAERNHSPKFWSKLGEIQPDWRERKALLKAWERRRAMEGWTVG